MHNITKETFIDGDFSMDVNVSKEDDTVWLSTKEIAKLYSRTVGRITMHIKNILHNENNEEKGSILLNNKDVAILEIDLPDGRTFKVKHYNLEMICEIGKRVGSNRGELLREFYEDHKRINYALTPTNNDIIIYDNGLVKLNVRISLEEDTVYLSKEDIADLFKTTRQTIEYHIKNIYETDELNEWATCKEILQVQFEGGREVTRYLPYYNLDVIISIGFRVNNKQGTAFRKWANSVLKQYLLKGYALDKNKISIDENTFIRLKNDVIDLQNRMESIEENMFIKPVKERLFFNGEYFDAYSFICSLIESAQSQIVLIDPYFDLDGLKMFRSLKAGVTVYICLSPFAKLKDQDMNAFNKQFGHVRIRKSTKFHDRFLIIDKSICYSLGTSLNYMGKKVFAVNKMEDEDIMKALLNKVDF